MEYKIAVISGDGIGPEIVREARKVLDRVGAVYGHKFQYEEVLMGGISIDTYGVPLTKEALETARSCDAVLRDEAVRFVPAQAGGGARGRVG